MTEDLFGAMDAPEDMTRPLAVRMRPSSVDEVVGQSRVLGQGSPLRRLANPASKGSLTAPSSIILFGPPGVGKTTLAYIVAKQSGRVFEELSAVTSGVKDVRDVLKRAHERLVSEGKETVLFIDEVHRFSKSQQDALLPSVENRDVTFIAATTENPSFSVIKPLLSRSVVVKLESLEPDDLKTLINRGFHQRVIRVGKLNTVVGILQPRQMRQRQRRVILQITAMLVNEITVVGVIGIGKRCTVFAEILIQQHTVAKIK